jgi:hypothetical protein
MASTGSAYVPADQGIPAHVDEASAPRQTRVGFEQSGWVAERDADRAAEGVVGVSIVMPCLNEVLTLRQCIREAQQALRQLAEEDGIDGEVMIADNGSSDGSIELAELLGARVVRVAKKGYGNALIGGIEQAYGRYVVMADSDASYDLSESLGMIRSLRSGYDLCMGSRFKGKILPGAMPFKNRYIGNPLLTGVLNLLFRSGLSDAHCGMRAFTKEAFTRMHLSSSGMEFASEMVIKATLLDLKRTEVPVTLRPDGRDRPPHLHPLRDGWRHLRYILMLSPFGLYFAPALFFGVLGAMILLLLLVNSASVVVDVGPVWFGDHWLIIASAMIIASHQAVMFGLATTIYGVRSGYRKPPRWLHLALPFLRLERALLLGVVLILAASAVLLGIFSSWSSKGFGELHQIRSMMGAVTLALIGMQSIFGGYLLAIVSGNEADFYDLLTTEGR